MQPRGIIGMLNDFHTKLVSKYCCILVVMFRVLACRDANASSMLLAWKGHLSKFLSRSSAVTTRLDTSSAFSWRLNTCGRKTADANMERQRASPQDM